MVGMAPEHEDPSLGSYNQLGRIPFYGKTGLNSGVMLMNLTRMREFQFNSKLLPIFIEFKSNLSFGDQCLLNILFHHHPGELYNLWRRDSE